MVEITEEEKKLNYAKYFFKKMSNIPDEKVMIGKNSAADSSKARDIEDINLFLSGDDDGLQVGFCVTDQGTGYVANQTYMPGVTTEMLDWWFPWHSVVSDLRYKIWDPEDHYHAIADNPEYVLDPNVPVNEKTWGANHDILEDIGMGPEQILLCFKKPSDFGYDMSLIGTRYCAGLVCAIGVGNTPAFMTHKWYPHKEGVMFESRFWMGYAFENGKFIKVIPEGVSIPEIVPRSLYNHNIKEYTHLAAILPSLYSEEKDNWK